MEPVVISVRRHPEMARRAVRYFQEKWASEKSTMIYEDCVLHCIDTPAPLPQWYLLCEGEKIVGCAGLIPNDFISRMDLYPWLCALYVEERCRCRGYAGRLMRQAARDAREMGFSRLYLCTDHVGYYERYGFSYLGDGYHPWGEASRIYGVSLEEMGPLGPATEGL